MTSTAVASLSLSSAIIAAPSATLSCHGGAFCRENVIAAGHDDALEEATDDCKHRGGKTSPSPCPRDGAAASCLVTSGEAGPITVLTYAQDDAKEQTETLSKMAELCEQFEGSFQLANAR